MMGRSHALSGTAIGFAAFSPVVLPHPAIGPLPAGELKLGAHLGDMSAPYIFLMCLILSVMALWPDIDTSKSLATNSIPPLTNWIHKLVAPFGHRKLTHVPLGFAIFASLVFLAASWTAEVGGVLIRPGNGIVTALCVAMLARAVGVKSKRYVIIYPLALFGFIFGAMLPATAMWFMPAAVFFGMWIHRLGDFITTDHVPPVTWPLFGNKKVGFAILGNAGSTREHVLFALMAIYSMYCVFWLLFAAIPG
ncbi:metal-dependent hydrolase [Actinomyces vulturis]|uniref:metal-dependent hydrolase n=1 Tax=Actinomyces vulturis TaxID=1857645 RepID=UPI000835CBF6|nr:metal-dependent hydrolase [Actinomyces vulturis]